PSPRPLSSSALSHRTPSHAPSSPCAVFFSVIPPPSRSTLFPYTTLFRSMIGVKVYRKEGQVVKSGVLNTVRGSEYIGLRFKTETPILNGIGRLNIGDSNWTIMGDDCEIGTEIEITGVDLNALRFKIITSDTDGTD